MYIQSLERQVLEEMDNFFKGIDRIDIVIPLNSAANTDAPQSHSEGDNFKLQPYESPIDNPPLVNNQDNVHIRNLIQTLEDELETCEDSSEKRSLKMRLTNLRKKLK